MLNQQPIVQQAVVQAHKSDTGSHQLIAYVKTTQDGDDIVPRLHAALHEQLPAYMVPAHFMQMKQFPLTASGKINRRALPIPDKLDIVRTTTLTAPETDLQKQLVQVWEDVLHVSPIGIHDNFFELGGHSLLALRLVSAIHKVTGVKLPLPRLFQEGTIAAIATYINDPIFETPLSPIIILRSGDPDLAPLILIHPGSGQVLPYLTLVDKLPAEQPIYGVQSLGLLPDTPAQIDIETMTATYLQALAEAQIPQPYHLTGWSMGGVVALEMAQQLAATNTPVRSLTLIDTYAPNNQSGEPNDTQLLQWFVQDAGYLMPSVKLTLLPDEAETGMQLQHLWQQLQETGDLPPALTLADLQQQFAVFRANYAAMQAYKPQRYSQPVHMIVAKDSAKSVRSKWLGWKKYFAKKSVNVLRTTHFDLLKAPHVTRIAKEITRKL
ncbi:MAG: alpha/beta fold hydrolase [Chloroflexi bacterium]|nr:alpha/beta fold hydrolase [Chloroflexota bacterium]